MHCSSCHPGACPLSLPAALPSSDAPLRAGRPGDASRRFRQCRDRHPRHRRQRRHHVRRRIGLPRRGRSSAAHGVGPAVPGAHRPARWVSVANRPRQKTPGCPRPSERTPGATNPYRLETQVAPLLGALWDRAPAIALEQTRQWAIRAALDACANGQYTSAASELEASRDAAVALAAMLADLAPEAEAHMLPSADQAELWAAEAWNAARA